jgi:hypothetical protein
MDVKGIWKNLVPTQLRPKEKVSKAIKSDSTTDRDGNGQTPFGEEQKRPMTEVEFEEAIKRLRSTEAVKNNQLIIEASELNGKRLVLVKDPAGKILRRIMEAELWSLGPSEDKKGQLLSKSA